MSGDAGLEVLYTGFCFLKDITRLISQMAQMYQSWMVQWLRLHLPIQGCWFDPWLGSQDPTCLLAKQKTETVL